MVFDSPIFLFLFLPFVLAANYACPRDWRNLTLLVLSLFFYAWSAFSFLWVIILSIAFNYAFGLATERSSGPGKKKALLAVSICFNLFLLIFYKYLDFLTTSLSFLKIIDASHAHFGQWGLPLGVSFFTFSAVAYQVDLYHGRGGAEKNPIAFGLYLSHFAKVIAGPIVRYRDMSRDLASRAMTIDVFSKGVSRFAFGLGKKVLLANPAAAFADEIFRRAGEIDAPTAWLGLAAYTIQIYFDFSGYTDMAIGVGGMLGFRFMENFNYPYISQSIQDFWRRWHISLSTWFRDYLYVPLGGSRGSEARTYFNLWVVFALCGLWHGANWTFIVWGGYHGFFLVLERAGLARALKSAWRPIRHLYSLSVIMVGWVFFRADNLSQAVQYLRALFSFSGGYFDYCRMTWLSRQLLTVLIVGCIASAPTAGLFARLRSFIYGPANGRMLRLCDGGAPFVVSCFAILVLVAAIMQLASSTYAPFIYARF